MIRATLTLIASLVASAVMACTTIESLPFVVYSPGSYCLNASLTYPNPNGYALTIASNDVTVDLRGNAITGTALIDNTIAIGISAHGRRNVTVKNGHVRGFIYGVQLESGTSYTVEKITSSGNAYLGIAAYGPWSVVRDSLIFDIGRSKLPGYTRPIGLRMSGEGILAEGNNIGDIRPIVESVGIAIDQARGGTLRNNIITSKALLESYAIWVNGSTTDLFVEGNRVSRWHYGLVFSSATGSYRNNTFFGVGTPLTGGLDAGGNVSVTDGALWAAPSAR